MVIDDTWQLLTSDYPLFLTMIVFALLYLFSLTRIILSLISGHSWQGGYSSFPSKRDPPGNNELETTKSNPFSNTFKMTGTIPLLKHMGRPSILQLIVLFVFKFNLKKNKIGDKSEPFDCHKYQSSKL